MKKDYMKYKNQRAWKQALFFYTKMQQYSIKTAFPVPQAEKNGTSPGTTGKKVKMKEEQHEKRRF